MDQHQKGTWWRRFNGALIPGVVVLWLAATYFEWMSSVKFLSHISLFALALAAVAAWRSDKPTPPE